MKTLLQWLTLIAVWSWAPLVAVVSTSVILAQTPIPEAPGIHVSLGVLGFVIGIVAIIAPAFYFAGRFNHRMTVVERDLERIVIVNTEAANRVASAIEELSTRLGHLEGR
jgi:hypothetical protein